MALRRSLLTLGLLAASGTFAAPGLAHIDLQTPPPRKAGKPESSLLAGPCGQFENGRVPERVSVFEPGQTIDVEWNVYVQHVSYFRVSFDLDGDDSFSYRASLPEDPITDDPTRLPTNPDEHVLAYIEDHTAGIDHVLERVTLPDEECDNCTLQVTQFTYNLPLNQATYYQCADITLRRLASSDGPRAGAADAGNAPRASEGDDVEIDRGCALAPGATPPAPKLLGSILVALAALLRRARRLGLERTAERAQHIRR